MKLDANIKISLLLNDIKIKTYQILDEAKIKEN